MKFSHFFTASILLLALFSGTVFAADSFGLDCPVDHCFVKLATFSNPTVNVTGCAVATNLSVNGQQYTTFATPGITFTAQGFGYYNYKCDDGASALFNAYAASLVNSAVAQTNSTSGVAIDSGESLCVVQNGCPVSGPYNIGYGNIPSIATSLSTAGGSLYQLGISQNPIAGTYGAPYDYSGSQQVYVGFPSLIVSGQGDYNTGYTEQSGTVSRQVIFTVLNQSPLDAVLGNYTIQCTGNHVTCAVDNSYRGYTIPAFNGKMVIRGTLTVDKSYLPSNAAVWLDVPYQNPLLASGACGAFTNSTTSSKPTTYQFGLLDTQKFQIGTKASYDYTGCVGENGMVGVTGSAYAPLINIGFGGTTDSSNKLISLNECDSTNPDAVYCNQKELLIELAAKISELWNIDMQELDATPAQKSALEQQKRPPYTGTQTYLRTQALSASQVQSSIAALTQNFNTAITNIGLYTSEGTNQYVAFGNDAATKTARMNSLFNQNGAMAITVNGGAYTGNLPAGLYTVNISVEALGAVNTRSLFNTDNSLNPAAKIRIDFSNYVEPKLKWFFYDYGYTDINSNALNPQFGGFALTNSDARGTLLTIEHAPDAPDFNNNKFYPTSVNTVVARLTADTNGSVDNNFSVTGLGSYTAPEFSYWTGIASNIADGCVNTTLAGDNTLPYRMPDSSFATTTTGSKSFAFDDYTLAKPSSTIYLETTLFSPAGFDTVQVNAPFGIIVDGVWHAGTPAAHAVQTVNAANADMRVTSLEELINAIKTEKACVNTGLTANRTTNWTVFWNQSKVAAATSAQVNNIITTQNRDANICLARAALGN